MKFNQEQHDPTAYQPETTPDRVVIEEAEVACGSFRKAVDFSHQTWDNISTALGEAEKQNPINFY